MSQNKVEKVNADVDNLQNFDGFVPSKTETSKKNKKRYPSLVRFGYFY